MNIWACLRINEKWHFLKKEKGISKQVTSRWWGMQRTKENRWWWQARAELTLLWLFALLITNCLISVTWPVSCCLFCISFIIQLFFSLPALQVPTQISIYYETLCPDSRRFFLHQLAPTYEKLNRYMDVELIPYGHANVSYPRHDNKPVFHCQHGPQGDYNYTLIKNSFSLSLTSLIFKLLECYGNKVQACTIDMLKDTTVSLNFVKCMFAQKDWHDTQTSAETVKIRIKMRFVW